eukprot:221289_1
MTANEEQQMEKEALECTYLGEGELSFESDDCFRIQISVEEILDRNLRSFTIFLCVNWPPDYPEVAPMLSITLSGCQIPESEISKMIDVLNEQATDLLGEMMTMSLVEIARENLIELQERIGGPVISLWESVQNKEVKQPKKSPTKKPVITPVVQNKANMTKTQKRAAWKHKKGTGEMSRGHDWVDLVSHLSKTGSS